MVTTPGMAQQAAVLVKPRPTVRYMSNSGFSHKPTKGKNYRFTGPLIVPFRQVEDPRTPFDAAERERIRHTRERLDGARRHIRKLLRIAQVLGPRAPRREDEVLLGLGRDRRVLLPDLALQKSDVELSS